MKQFLLYSLLFLAGIAGVRGQVTTSSMNGSVKDSKGEFLIGATIKAVHQPTGTSYGASTNVEGRFTIANMRVGGPYRIEVTYIGYQSSIVEGVNLRLGEPFTLNAVLNQTGVGLNEVVIVGTRDQVFNSRRTGAATNISREQIENLPTINRSLQDYTRITPQANGNSFGSTSNKFNNITVDGAVNNDVFQAVTGAFTPGAAAGTQPISIDAIQEIQVVLAPYDVTYGNFTGAGVNAVTRSGTNKFEGSAYFFNKNERINGRNVLTNQRSTDFTDSQYGFRLGGPIVKDKLFFFTNIELGRRSSPLTNNAGEAGAAISEATAQSIANYAANTYGYNVGSFNPLDVKRENNKIFGKIDWNIDTKNQLTVRYNYIDAFDDNITRTPTFFQFGNNGYVFNNKQHVGIVELRSNINNRVSNNLLVGYTRIRDKRSVNGALFPQVTIQNLEGVAAASAELGSQRSSVANELDQDIFEVTNNVRISSGIHNITVGTHNEFFSFRNLFINNLNGRWDFTSVSEFLAGRPDRIRATYSRDPNNPQPAAEFAAAQLSVYGQDEFEAFKGFRLTAGMRIDLPVFYDKPVRNPQIEASFPGYRTNRTPARQPLFSPRLGFNYDVLGNRSLQVRGGTGVFTGRVPFVWMSNQYGNSGMLFSTVDVRRSANPNLVFIADVNNQKNAGAGSNRAEVNLISTDFRIPQVFRNNLAVDFKLPLDIRATLEGIYSKTLNSITYQDINLKPSTASIAANLSGGADTRPAFGAKVDNPNFTNVVLLDNTNKGYTYNLTAQLQKSFAFGLNASIAYTKSDARSVNDGTSSTALSNWEFTQIVTDPNNAPLATSYYLTRHRVVGSLGYNVSYGKNKTFGTGISVFYAGYSGNPYTYLYNGDVNGDGAFSNDLLYVPRTQSEIKLVPFYTRNASNQVVVSPDAATPAQQWEALNAFIESDPYLSTKRGQYVERNGAEMPFQHQIDLRISQDLGGLIKRSKNGLQLTLDIFNIGNLVNKDWGRQYFVTNQAVTLISYNTNQSSDRGFNFTAPSSGKGYQTSAFGSAWSAQFGVRYLFSQQ